MLKVGRRQAIRTVGGALGVGVSDLRKFARGDAAFRDLDARLMASGKVSLSDIAAQAGYADQAHFSRECQSVIGRSPGAFLRQFEKDEADWIYRTMLPTRRRR